MAGRIRASAAGLRRRVVGAREVQVDHGRGPGSSGEIVFCGPMPPAATGIATYDRAVLDGLTRIGFFDRHDMDVKWPIGSMDAISIAGYHLGVFQLGNNIDFHLEVYRAAFLTNALVVLHDLALDDFVRALRAMGEPLGFMAGREAARLQPNLSSPDALRNEPLRVPWAGHVARRARGIIVHADFARSYLREAGVRTPIFVVPHPVIEEPSAIVRATEEGRRIRARLAGRGIARLVVAPGDINEAKRLDALAAAAALLDDDVHVAIVGRRLENFDPQPAIDASPAAARISVETDVSDEAFLAWIAAADVVVDLRYPHRGEVSGSLARAMQIGRPSVVSATGTYLDLPDDQVMRVAAGPPDPRELAQHLRLLLGDDDLRSRMGEAAAASMSRSRQQDDTAHGYERAIEQTLTLVRDPARKALAIWGRALVDAGVTEEMVETGYGMEYARALASFKGSPRRGDEDA
jgi:glycosyltransferase involved in cell wall biosynthesis